MPSLLNEIEGLDEIIAGCEDKNIDFAKIPPPQLKPSSPLTLLCMGINIPPSTIYLQITKNWRRPKACAFLTFNFRRH